MWTNLWIILYGGNIRSLNMSEAQAEFEDTCSCIPHMGTHMPTLTHATHIHEPLTEELCTPIGGSCLIWGTLQSLLSHVSSIQTRFSQSQPSGLWGQDNS